MSILNANTYVALISLVAISIVTYWVMWQVDRGRKFFVRRIPGLDVLDEAIERTTELGGVVNSNIGDMADLSGVYVGQTIAGLEVLGYVAKKCAKLRTKLLCSIFGRSGSGGDMIAVQTEILHDSYAAEGREEDFSATQVRYLGGDFQAYENGIFDFYVREKVTTNVYIGAWAGKGGGQPQYIAKALGITNITGTVRLLALPQLAMSSDYFFIGEEIFAAGAELSQDPATTGTVALSDYFKYIALAILIIGNIALWAGSDIIKRLLSY